MKFCTQVPRTCVHQPLSLSFSFYLIEFHTGHKIQPINIKYLPNLQFLSKMAHKKHTQTYKEHKKTVESVFASRFTMNNIVSKLQKC